MSSSLDCLVNNLARGGHEFFGFESYNDRQLMQIANSKRNLPIRVHG